MVVWLILYFADALLITDSRSSHCFLVNSQNCGKRGEKKGRERERLVCSLVYVYQKRNTPLFFCFFFREKNRLPAALPTTCHFVFVFQATRPAAAPKTKAASVSPTTVTISSFNYSLSLSAFFFFVNFRERRKERKKKLKSKRKLNQK